MVVLYIGFSVIGALALFFTVIIWNEYQPQKVEDVYIYKNDVNNEVQNDLMITTWNIGFGGFDQSKDFFLDGGSTKTTISKEEVRRNLSGIRDTIHKLQSDIVLLQEVDEPSTRSTYINEISFFLQENDLYNALFCYNYRTLWVPYPLMNPLGHVNSGLATLSHYQFVSSKRIALQGQEPFPKRLFFPKRAMMVHEMKINDVQTFYVINTHLAAYDKDGEHRLLQLKHIFSYIDKLLENPHNYVIVGGDFNLYLGEEQIPSNAPSWVQSFPTELQMGTTTVYADKSTNTVRSLNTPYQKGTSFETVIDGFIVSNNLIVHDVSTHNLEYQFSDHNPVSIYVSIPNLNGDNNYKTKK